MPKSDTQRIEQLESQVNALQQLLLAHVVAFDAVDGPATDATLMIAAGQADSALARGRVSTSIRVGALIKNIQQCRD